MDTKVSKLLTTLHHKAVGKVGCVVNRSLFNIHEIFESPVLLDGSEIELNGPPGAFAPKRTVLNILL